MFIVNRMTTVKVRSSRTPGTYVSPLRCQVCFSRVHKNRRPANVTAPLLTDMEEALAGCQETVASASFTV